MVGGKGSKKGEGSDYLGEGEKERTSNSENKGASYWKKDTTGNKGRASFRNGRG